MGVIKKALVGVIGAVCRLVVWVVKLPIKGVLILMGINYKAKLLKTRLIILFLLMGVAWCPLTMLWTINDPVRAHYLLAKIGVGAFMVYKDVKVVTKSVYKGVVPETVRRGVDRYNLDALVNMPMEVAGRKKAPLYYRMWRGVTKPFRALIGV